MNLPVNNLITEQVISEDRMQMIKHINLQLAALDQPVFCGQGDHDYLGIAGDLLRRYKLHNKLLADFRSPADQRIQDFLNAYFKEHGIDEPVALPGDSFILDRPTLAREMSLAPDRNSFLSRYVSTYRLEQGILNNPGSDRRTTKDVFHIVEGGLPVPTGKKAVPVNVFHEMFCRAMNPPEELTCLPFTNSQSEQASLWVSLLLRPEVSPEITGITSSKSLEVRFFAPGSLVSNLDFVERIFGNAGDPCSPENDSALDIDHWTGHTGCVILAPQLTGSKAKDLGCPHYDDATDRQRKEGVYWKNEDDLYNNGLPFKVVCRDMRGVIVTIITDNYYGYSKKEIKSQISYSANLFGCCEEEHAGGAYAFPCYNLGDTFKPDDRIRMDNHIFDQVQKEYSIYMDIREGGYGIDKTYPNIIYIPEDTEIDLLRQSVRWVYKGITHQLKLFAKHTYIYPCGYKVRMEKHPKSPTWRLIGSDSEGVFIHKPCTVSGGGKSEISKSISGTVLSGSLYVDDIKQDLDQVEQIFTKDYSSRFRQAKPATDSRKFLSGDRSLGSSIRLLTPSETEYTDEYNKWLETIPQHIRALAFIIKRFFREEWGNNWRHHFTVDVVNGHPGHELKYDDRKLVSNYLRVGEELDGSWRIYKLRQDYIASDKVQMEDDISVSYTVAAEQLNHLNGINPDLSVKLVVNCENKLFQRPDDAIHRGLDLQAESDLSGDDNFVSNYEPLQRDFAEELIEDAIGFTKYSASMQNLIQRAANISDGRYFISSAHPRLVDGKPTLNVRYLQDRPDVINARDKYIAEMGMRLYRRVPANMNVNLAVNAVIPGRRNNPPELKKNIRSLAVYNPIHYQELPELFMDFISSLTGKSPSTTGAGSEGAMTKGPFNALSATADLNNVLVSYILTGYDGFSSAAGFIGTDYQVAHDISLLVPEIWCRTPVEHRSADYMIEHGYLEQLQDFEYEGKTVLASRLGYRITKEFVHAYMGKLFDNPNVVFEEEILKPEKQDMYAYVDGINNIVEAQQRVALEYIENDSVNNACPPLKALLCIMAEGNYQGKKISDPEIREMFTSNYLLNSDWYLQRLEIKQQRDVKLWQKHSEYINYLLENNKILDNDDKKGLQQKLAVVKTRLEFLSSDEYLQQLRGTIGADWIDVENESVT